MHLSCLRRKPSKQQLFERIVVDSLSELNVRTKVRPYAFATVQKLDPRTVLNREATCCGVNSRCRHNVTEASARHPSDAGQLRLRRSLCMHDVESDTAFTTGSIRRTVPNVFFDRSRRARCILPTLRHSCADRKVTSRPSFSHDSEFSQFSIVFMVPHPQHGDAPTPGRARVPRVARLRH
jgi:hypothetical protein